MIRVRQVRAQQRDGRERERSVHEELEDERESPYRPRGFDATVGGMLRKVQHLCAVGEERRAAFAEIQAARVDFGETRDQFGSSLPLGVREALQIEEELTICGVSERWCGLHVPLYHRLCQRLQVPRSARTRALPAATSNRARSPRAGQRSEWERASAKERDARPRAPRNPVKCFLRERH